MRFSRGTDKSIVAYAIPRQGIKIVDTTLRVPLHMDMEAAQRGRAFWSSATA